MTMIRKLLAFTLAALVISLGCVTFALAQTDKEAQRVAQMKHAVNKIGIDENAKVRLHDGTKLKGHISEIGEDYFVLIEEKTANSNRISFAQVKQVRPKVDNPFGDPGVLMGIGLIPVIIAIAILGGRSD